MNKLQKNITNGSFTNNVISVLSSKIVCYVIGLISSVYLAKILGPAGKGKLTVITSISGIILQFGNLGLHSAHTYYIAKDKNQISKCEGNIILLVLFSFILIPIGIFYFTRHEKLLNLEPFFVLIAFLFVPFNMLLMLQENMFIAINKVRYFNILQILENSLFFGIIILLSRSLRLNIRIIVICMLSATILISIYSFSIYYWTVEKKIIVSIKYFFSILPYGMKSYSACLAAYLVLRVDMFMLNYFSNDYEVGIYSLAVNLLDMSYMLSSSVSIILFPKLGTMKNILEKKKLVKKVFFQFTPILVAIYLLMGGMAPYIIPVLYGVQYNDTIYVLEILIPGALCWASSSYLFQFFASENKFSPTIVVPALALIADVLLNCYFIPIAGNIGAAIASTCSYVICLAGMCFCYFYHIRIKQRTIGTEDIL